jgi:hypothetical protein
LAVNDANPINPTIAISTASIEKKPKVF